MFYVKNSSYASYIEKKYKNNLIINDYVDENLQENNVIFEERSLKPRCHESLAMLTDLEMVQAMYEGFTNRIYEVYSTMPAVNTIIMSTTALNKTDAIKTIGTALTKKYYRQKIWDDTTKIYKSFVDKSLADDVFNYINSII